MALAGGVGAGELALNWLFSLTHHIQHFLVDFGVSALWFIVFGLFVKYMGATSCATNHLTGVELSVVVCVISSKPAKRSAFWLALSGWSML
jgi:hypothetical protein